MPRRKSNCDRMSGAEPKIEHNGGNIQGGCRGNRYDETANCLYGPSYGRPSAKQAPQSSGRAKYPPSNLLANTGFLFAHSLPELFAIARCKSCHVTAQFAS